VFPPTHLDGKYATEQLRRCLKGVTSRIDCVFYDSRCSHTQIAARSVAYLPVEIVTQIEVAVGRGGFSPTRIDRSRCDR